MPTYINKNWERPEWIPSHRLNFPGKHAHRNTGMIATNWVLAHCKLHAGIMKLLSCAMLEIMQTIHEMRYGTMKQVALDLQQSKVCEPTPSTQLQLYVQSTQPKGRSELMGLLDHTAVSGVPIERHWLWLWFWLFS
jgi:hypothetical protein